MHVPCRRRPVVEQAVIQPDKYGIIYFPRELAEHTRCTRAPQYQKIAHNVCLTYVWGFDPRWEPIVLLKEETGG